MKGGMGWRKAYGNEEVRNLSFILEPGLAVLGAAAGNVSVRAVGNHAREEDGVEPGEGAPVGKKKEKALVNSYLKRAPYAGTVTYSKPVMRPQDRENQRSEV